MPKVSRCDGDFPVLVTSLTRDRAVRQLVWLITRRSQVQILFPLLRVAYSNYQMDETVNLTTKRDMNI